MRSEGRRVFPSAFSGRSLCSAISEGSSKEEINGNKNRGKSIVPKNPCNCMHLQEEIPVEMRKNIM